MMPPQKPRSFAKKKGKRQGQQQQQQQRSMSSSDSLSALFDTSSNPTIGGEGETSSSSFRDFVDTSTLTGTVTTRSPTVSASFTTTNTTSNNTTSTSSGVFTAGSPQSNNRHKNILNRTASNVLVVQPTLRRINHSIEDEYTIDKLRFDTLLSQRTLIGRQQEQQILYQALEAVQGNVLGDDIAGGVDRDSQSVMQEQCPRSSVTYEDRAGVQSTPRTSPSGGNDVSTQLNSINMPSVMLQFASMDPQAQQRFLQVLSGLQSLGPTEEITMSIEWTR